MFKKRVRLLLQNFVLEVPFLIANQSPYEMYQHEYFCTEKYIVEELNIFAYAC